MSGGERWPFESCSYTLLKIKYIIWDVYRLDITGHKTPTYLLSVQQSGSWLSFSHRLRIFHSLLCGFGPHDGLHSSAGHALSAHAVPVLIQVWSIAYPYPLLYAGLKSLFALALLCDAKSVLFLRRIHFHEQQELPASCSVDVLFSLAVCTGL